MKSVNKCKPIIKTIGVSKLYEYYKRLALIKAIKLKLNLIKEMKN